MALDRRRVLRTIADTAAAVLAAAGRDVPDRIAADVAFRSIGFDSLAALSLADRLGAALGIDLPASSAFDHPTPAALADAIAGGAAVVETAPTSAFPNEPIAIVSAACRYPGGANSPEALWQLVEAGADAVGDLPRDRGWDLAALLDDDPDRPGTTYAHEGGFLYEAAEFDADFFGISPREALTMDPQQRLLLETSWELFERAGIDPDAARGPRTGVYVGAEPQDYGPRLQDAPDGLEGYLLTGNAPSVVAGRIAYVFGLGGPTVTVDTACSGSLVAIHLAAQALRAGECDLALAGGVAIMSTPGTFTAFSRQRGLAPDGRCKPFSGRADGTAWGEGVGLLLVERLSDARRHGHRVLAVVAGSAINQDGASNGLTAPNGPSQQRVIRAALSAAGLTGADVDVVEAHGTGTPLGDPIEAQAVIATYGQQRETPLWLGSLKANIGHTQAAAGVGGVIKMIEAMRHGVVPASLHSDPPSDKIDWTAGAVELVTANQPWPVTAERPRRAGVSSFGISGTNAHVVLESAPVEETPAAPDDSREWWAWPVSARTPVALQSAAAALAAVDVEPAAAARALAARHDFEHRAVVLGAGADDYRAGLRSLAGDGDAADVDVVAGPAVDGDVAILFTGQGSQRPQMGHALYETFPVYRAAFDTVCAHLDLQLDRPLRSIVFAAPGSDEAALLDQTGYTQPALFALEVALYRLVESWGVRPDVLGGHSVGEIAAAHVAGVLDLADAALLVGARARLMQALPAGGAMVAVDATEDEVRDLLTDGVDIAAVNGPRALVIAGDEEPTLALATRLAEQGRRTKRLAVSHAFHSPLMEPMLDEFADVVDLLTFRPPRIPLVSGLTGGLDADVCDPGYWVRHVRAAVRFGDAVRTLQDDGVATVVELGPDAVLSALIPASAPDVAPLAALRRGHDEPRSLLRAVATLHVRGGVVDLGALAGPGAVADLPTYPFQRQRFWLDAPRATGSAADLGLDESTHPLLGAELAVGDTGRLVLTGRWSRDAQPWLADHVIGELTLAPGTALLDLAVHAADRLGLDVEELTLQAPLAVPATGAVVVQVVVGPAGDGRRPLDIHSRPEAGDDDLPPAWTTHATGSLHPVAAPDVAPTPWPPAGAEEVALDDFYGGLADDGYHYGPAFRGVRKLWRAGVATHAEVSLPAGLDPTGFGLHPALLDAALQTVGYGAATGSEPEIPFAWTGVSLRGRGATTLRVSATPAASGHRITLTDPAGAVVASVDALVTRPIPATAAAVDVRRGALFGFEWAPVTVPGGAVTATTLGPDGLASLAAAIDRGAVAPARVLAPLAPADAADVPAAVRATTAAVLSVVQQWLADARFAAGTLALTVDQPEHPAVQAALGLVRSAQAEHPDRIVVIEHDGATPAQLAAAADLGEPHVALRDGAAFARRLAPVASAADPAAWPVDETIMITGGAGGLGLLVAEHLVATHGARRLLLVSRRCAADPAVLTRLRALAEVDVVACDLSDRSALAALLAERPVGAIVHAAGVLDDGLVAAQTPERIDRVLAPKADVAWWLHELTADAPLRAFVLFSSAAASLDGAGQGNYAVANASLEALAATRAAAGLPVTSIGWTLWDAPTGMAATLGAADLARVAASGLPGLDVPTGLALLDAAVAGDQPVTLALRLDPAALRRRAAGIPHLLRRIVRVAPQSAATASVAGSATGLAATLAELPPDQRVAAVLDVVRAELATALGHGSADAVDATRAFSALGVDSLAAIDFRNRLTAATGLRLPATLVFDYPTCAAIAQHVHDELVGADVAAPAPVAARVVDGDDPMVIVGMACRYPGGVASADDLWYLVSNGVDGIGEFPADRGWDLEQLYDPEPGKPDRTYSKNGGFLYDAAEFDAGFFGISPREAQAMDPQQRLLLEASWEALEHAQLDPERLRGSRTGVFAGVMYHDFGPRLLGVPDEYKGYLGNGSLGSVVSGRVSYALGLEGPAVTVDTACSSSLVALHLAGQALRAGDCDLALVGGVTVMTSPDTFVDFSLQRGLAADGRCKAFGAGADGTGWGEGVGVLVVERRSRALELGHRVLAVVRGSAVNQDGASNGLTAPSGPAQQRVIRAALASAALTPADVDVVEAHGTGTALGDPIEAQAVLATYGQDRSTPLWLGSLKSNIGHTQAAAGVGGIIKMVQAMRHGVVPPTLHADTPSDKVDWDAGAVRLATSPQPWPAADRPRRAAVSSFGISGTNAHVIVESSDVAAESSVVAPNPAVWPISAKSAGAVRGYAALLRETLAGGADTTAVAAALAGRTAFEQRGALVVETTGAATFVEPVGSAAARVAVVFSGQGSQRVGMGSGLASRFPVFADAFDQACAAFDGELQSVIDGAAGDLGDTRFTQPALFAFEVALYRLLESFGLAPVALTGHSLGEITAAHLSGVLSLPDAAALITARASLMAALPAGGAMVAVSAPSPEAAQALQLPEQVCLGAVNSPTALVLSGDHDPVHALAETLQADGWRATTLAVSHAFHSHRIEPMLDAFAQTLQTIQWGEPTVPVVSNLTGQTLAADTDWTAYWVEHARHAVAFRDSVATLATDYQPSCIVEVGPDTTLTHHVAATVDVPALATQTRKRDEVDAFHTALATLWTQNAVTTVTHDDPTPLANPLPPYAFQHERYWLTSAPTVTADLSSAGIAASAHPLLGGLILDPDGDHVTLTGRLDAGATPWLREHEVHGRVVLPGAALVDLVVHAAHQLDPAARVDELSIATPLVLTAEPVTLQVGADRAKVTVHTRAADGGWTLHAAATLTTATPTILEPAPVDGESLDTTTLYDELATAGLRYGPTFATLADVRVAAGAVHGRIALPEGTDVAGYAIHPALLDAALHTIGLDEWQSGQPVTSELPFVFGGVTVHRPGATSARVVTTRAGSTATVRLIDEAGEPILTVDELTLRPVSRQQLVTDDSDRLFALDWTPVDAPTASLAATDTVVDCPGTTGETLTLLQEWLARDDDRRLVLLTRHATGADVDPGPAACRGLARAAQAENPGRIALVDHDGDLRPLAAALAVENDVALRSGRVLVPRLRRIRATTAPTVAGPVLLTGGTGGIGARLARHLVEQHGVRRLVLPSRRGLDAPGAPQLAAALTALGADAQIVQCDVADRAQLTALLASTGQLGGVVHAAGVLDDSTVAAMTASQLEVVLRPKLDAALLLDELCGDVDFFVLFSSIAGTVDPSGQGNYAAANAALDALAAQRRRRGAPAVSLAWGLWGEDGMAAGLDEVALRRLARAGIRPLDTDTGLRLFDAALDPALPAAVVPVDADLAALRSAGDAAPVWHGLVPPPAAAPSAPATVDLDSPDAVVAAVRGVVADVLGHQGGDAVDVDRGLGELGVDSLAALELRNRLATLVGAKLPATLTFDYPTVRELAAHLETRLQRDLAPPVEDAAALHVLLDRLEAAAGSAGVDAAVRDAVGGRLRALARVFGGDGADLDTASADELFSILDDELDAAS